MALITTGAGFIRALEENGSLGLYAPLEGGFEGRYLRRVRARGYQSLSLTARGLGDLSAYLFAEHGVRPPHLGKKNIGQDGAVGPVYFAQAIAGLQLSALPANSKGLVLWILEGYVLSPQELEYLAQLPGTVPQLKVVVELGGERFVRWQPLSQLLGVA